MLPVLSETPLNVREDDPVEVNIDDKSNAKVVRIQSSR